MNTFRDKRKLNLWPVLIAFLLNWTQLGLCAPNLIVAPTNMVTEDSIAGSGTIKHSLRVQEVYGSVNFPTGGLLITELRFRPDYHYGFAFTTTVASIEVRLSTTAAEPERLNPVFAQNVGEDETVVFNGPLQISSQFIGPAFGPKQFDMAIPLSTPFVYAPARGNLLLEIRNMTGASGASHLSGQNRGDDSASRVVTGNVLASFGTPDTAVDALEIVYFATNGPAEPPPRLMRGPYLQCRTTTNIIVRWRTSRPTDGRVQFGLAAEGLSWEVSAPELTSEHVLTLTNLSPETKYFYSIGTSEGPMAGGADYFFLTAPTHPKSTRIWAIGDSGTAGQPGYQGMAAAVRDAYANYTGTRPTDVWLMLGDNAYGSGFDSEFQAAVFEAYPNMLRQCAVWPTLGNHDVTTIGGDYAALNVFSYVTQGEAGGIASGSKHYYSFNYGGVHFVCLDSEDSDRSPGGAMLTWLEQDLSANTNQWLIAFWHRPPYAFGTHNSDFEFNMVEMRENAVPILEAHGVDLVLTGHSHDYERSYLIDGHYGSSTTLSASMIKDSGNGREDQSGPYLKTGPAHTVTRGAVYVVAGSSGWVTQDGGWGQHPIMYAKIRELGSMVVDVNGDRLDAKFLRETGAIDDYFTIIKHTTPGPPRWTDFRVSGNIVTARWESIPGASYHIEQATDLALKNWTPVSDTISANATVTEWSQFLPPGPVQRFFRVVQGD